MARISDIDTAWVLGTIPNNRRYSTSTGFMAQQGCVRRYRNYLCTCRKAYMNTSIRTHNHNPYNNNNHKDSEK